jgi:hypothetical protein
MKILFLLAFISQTLASIINEFKNKNIFFSVINDNIPENLKIETIIKKPYMTDMVILKLEKELEISDYNTDKNFTILINKDYYEITSSYNNKIKNIKTVGFKSNESAVYRKFRYHKQEFTESGLNFMNSNIKTSNNTNSFELFNHYYIDVNVKTAYHEVRKFVTNQLFHWDENAFIEFIFVYDERTQKNSLYKIFVYYSALFDKHTYVSILKECENMKNIFMYFKDSKKILKYTKDYKNKEKEKMTVRDFSPSFNYYIVDFDKKISVFHNMMNLSIDKAFFKNPKNDFTCVNIFQYLTEDIYIEKNELINYIKSKYRNTVLSASNFIDQELSADNISPYYVGFRLCGEVAMLQNITYPFHFRYQPPSYNDSHADVRIPMPIVSLMKEDEDINSFILTLSDTSILDKENYFVRKGRDKTQLEIYNERSIFFDEVLLKLNILERYNVYIYNRDRINQLIPIGRTRDVIPVAVVTGGVTFIGFIMILYEIIKYSMRTRLVAPVNKPKGE